MKSKLAPGREPGEMEKGQDEKKTTPGQSVPGSSYGEEIHMRPLVEKPGIIHFRQRGIPCFREKLRLIIKYRGRDEDSCPENILQRETLID